MEAISIHPEGGRFDVSEWEDAKYDIVKLKEALKAKHELKEADKVFVYKGLVSTLTLIEDDATLTDADYPIHYIWARPFQNLKKSGFLNHGRFGHVYIFDDKQKEGVKYAVRHFLKEFKNEFGNYFAAGKHPRILELLDFLYENTSFFEVMPIYMNNSIKEYLYEKKTMPLSEAKHYAPQVVEGLLYLHSRKIIHRDIKGATILIDDNFDIKISGMTESVDLSHLSQEEIDAGGKHGTAGTVRWLAPEMICDEPYTPKIDVWSFGCLVINLVTGHGPFHDIPDYRSIYLTGHERLVCYHEEGVQDFVKEFIKYCCNPDKEARPTMTEVAKHPFLKLEGKVNYIPFRSNDEPVVLEVPYPRVGMNVEALQKGIGKHLNKDPSDFMFFRNDKIMRADTVIDFQFEIEVKYKCLTGLGQYEEVKELGFGTFGKTVLMMHKTDKKEYSFKKLKFFLAENYVVDRMMDVVRRLTSIIPNQYLARVYELHQNREDLLIRSEYFPNGSLYDIVKKNGPLEKSQLKKYGHQIIYGLDVLHKERLFHSNLKASNVLMDSSNNCRLSDYGLVAKFIEFSRDSYRSGMSFHFMRGWEVTAPEIMMRGEFHKQTDVWSFAELMLEVSSPIQETDEFDRRPRHFRMRKQSFDKALENDAKVSSDLSNLLKACHNEKPDQRPTISDLKKHKYFN